MGDALGIDLDLEAAEYYAQSIDETLREYYRPLDALGDSPPPVALPAYARVPAVAPRRTRSTRGTGAPTSAVPTKGRSRAARSR